MHWWWSRGRMLEMPTCRRKRVNTWRTGITVWPRCACLATASAYVLALLRCHFFASAVCWFDVHIASAWRAGAIDAVLAVMRAHVGNVDASKQACWAMRMMCLPRYGALSALCALYLQPIANNNCDS